MLKLEDRCLWHCPVQLLTHLVQVSLSPCVGSWRLGSGITDFQYWGSYSSDRILLAGICDEEPGRVPWACHSWNIDSISIPSRNGLKGSHNTHNWFSVKTVESQWKFTGKERAHLPWLFWPQTVVGRQALGTKACLKKYPADFEKEEEKNVNLEEVLKGITRMAPRSCSGLAG